MDRQILKKHRRKALDKLFDKYPKGFTIRNMLEESPKLYNKQKQAADYLAVIRESERCISMRREGTNCLYVYVPDTYKLLNKLWQKKA